MTVNRNLYGKNAEYIYFEITKQLKFYPCIFMINLGPILFINFATCINDFLVVKVKKRIYRTIPTTCEQIPYYRKGVPAQLFSWAIQLNYKGIHIA